MCANRISTSFRVGQKVVCINSDCSDDSPGPYITVGSVYTISWIGTVLSLDQGYAENVDLFELPAAEIDSWCRGYASESFRPLDGRETDISVFREILNPVHESKKVTP